MTHEISFDFDNAAEHSIDAETARAIDKALATDLTRAVADAAKSTALRDDQDYGVFLGVEAGQEKTDPTPQA